MTHVLFPRFEVGLVLVPCWAFCARGGFVGCFIVGWLLDGGLLLGCYGSCFVVCA